MEQTQVVHFTGIQRRFLDALLVEPQIANIFYLTGGTALAAFYLNHRFSEDIDLFTTIRFEEPLVTNAMNHLSASLAIQTSLLRVGDRPTYSLTFSNQAQLKVDFVYYPYEHIEHPSRHYRELQIDSLGDIAVNKLLAISQRTASKDFVDLYFLLKKYSLWDLRHGVEHKFHMEIESLYLSSLFLKVSELTTLPIMKKKLTLEQLKKFFLQQAKTLAAPMLKP